MKKIFLLFLFINLLFFTNNFANAVEEPIEVECPLGGSNAKGWKILGSAFYGVLLDGRQYGAHVGPLPPPECREKQLIKIMYSKEEKLIYTTTLMNFAPLILLWLCFHIH